MSQDILITPKSGEPQILFRGSGTTDTPISLNVLSSYQSATGSGTAIVFEGTQGQLFGVTDNLSSGTIFSVSDITGLPSLEFLANGELKLGEFGSGVNVYNQNFGVTLTGTGSPATHIPVFIADPSSSISRLYHRTAAQLRSDIGAGTGNGTVTSVATNNGVTGGTITTTGTIGLTGNALSLHNLATNGVIARTAANTVTARTITGTTNQVTVTNGDGVAGNPTLALPQNIHTAATPTFSSIVLTGSIGAEDAIRVTNGRIQLGPATFGAGVWLDRTSSQRYWFVGMDASDGTTLRFFRGSDRLLLDLNGNATLNANLNLRAPATGVAATQIPVFTADPASTTRLLVTRTPAQLLSDIGAQATLTNPVTGTGASGQVSFWTGASTQSGSSNLFWDNVNARLGIGDSSPSDKIVINGRARISSTNVLCFGTAAGGYADIGIIASNSGTLVTRTYNGSSFVERMRIVATDGNVGIGSTSPVARLHLETTSTTVTGVIVRGAASQTADLQQWQNNSATALASVGAGGNLSLRAPATGVVATQIPVFTADPASTTRLLVTRTPAELRADIGAQATLTNPVTGTGSNGWVSFWTGTNTQSADNNLFWNNTNKRLGVGTISPENRLDVIGLVDVRNNMGVAGNFESSAIRIRTQNTVDNTGWQGIRFDTSTTANHGWALGINRTSSGYGSFKLYEHHNNISGVERLTILPSGNVGIGTASPTASLHIQGNGARIRLSTSSNPGLYRFDIESNFNAGDTINFYGTNNFNFLKWIYSNSALCLNPNGGVLGVGTTSPVSRLHLNTVTAASTGVIIRGSASQSADLQQWQNSSATALASVGAGGNLSLRAPATGVVATQIPVFTADPASTTRLLVTRTPAQLRSDIQAVSTADSRIGVIYDSVNEDSVSMTDDEWTFPSNASAENLRTAIDAVGSIPVANASGVDNIMVMSEATYNALSPKNANTLYFLT